MLVKLKHYIYIGVIYQVSRQQMYIHRSHALY